MPGPPGEAMNDAKGEMMETIRRLRCFMIAPRALLVTACGRSAGVPTAQARACTDNNQIAGEIREAPIVAVKNVIARAIAG